MAAGPEGLDVQALFFGDGQGFFVGGNGGKVHAGMFFDGIFHGHAVPRRRQVDFRALVVDDGGAQNFFSGVGKHVLGNAHHFVHVHIGLVQLDISKFRIVTGVHAFVSEHFTHFVNLVEAADDEALQEKLVGNTHLQIDVQGIVVGQEGACVGAAGHIAQDGRFHFQKALVV